MTPSLHNGSNSWWKSLKRPEVFSINLSRDAHLYKMIEHLPWKKLVAMMRRKLVATQQEESLVQPTFLTPVFIAFYGTNSISILISSLCYKNWSQQILRSDFTCKLAAWKCRNGGHDPVDGRMSFLHEWCDQYQELCDLVRRKPKSLSHSPSPFRKSDSLDGHFKTLCYQAVHLRRHC